MTKSISTSKKPHKRYLPEFSQKALKSAESISIAAARELNLYEPQLDAWPVNS